MTKIIDAHHACSFESRKVVFDTNIWLYIDGGDLRKVSRVYSDYYKSARDRKNIFIINDYVLSEFFNRSCKIQYNLCYDDDPTMRQFKERRKSKDFQDFMETVRDTCLNMIDDCEYEPALDPKDDVKAFIAELGEGRLDFTDLVLREHCLKRNYVLVSHDADFGDCGLEIVTANSRLLKKRT